MVFVISCQKDFWLQDSLKKELSTRAFMKAIKAAAGVPEEKEG
jgi:hypothetical protein